MVYHVVIHMPVKSNQSKKKVTEIKNSNLQLKVLKSQSLHLQVLSSGRYMACVKLQRLWPDCADAQVGQSP